MCIWGLFECFGEPSESWLIIQLCCYLLGFASRGLATDDQYDVDIDIISQLGQLIENVDIDKAIGEIGIEKLKENIIQIFGKHTNKLIGAKNAAMELLKGINFRK